MINEKIRISVTDLPARPSRPTEEEMEQIFGGWWGRRFFRRVGRSARRLGRRGWRAGRRIARRVGRGARRLGRRVSRTFRRIFRGW